MNRAVDPTSLSRILLTVDAIGDAWHYVFGLATELSSRGAEVLVAALQAPPADVLRVSGPTLDGRAGGDLLLEVAPFALTGAEPPWRVAAAAKPWLERLAAAWAPDVVHLSTLGHGALAVDAPVVSVVHAAALAWYDASAQRFPGPIWSRQDEVIARGLRRSALVAAPTAPVLETVGKRYGAFPRTLVLDTQSHADLVARAWSVASHLHVYGALIAESRARRASTDTGTCAVLR
ncbi:MAG: glycosyltransferase [Myxococcales bacterium]|nr:glycosyltransferase [Myxococcales bacterium]MCB9733933.1 glycosyltransferase [Deltaproteobacteria bacterium]